MTSSCERRKCFLRQSNWRLLCKGSYRSVCVRAFFTVVLKKCTVGSIQFLIVHITMCIALKQLYRVNEQKTLMIWKPNDKPLIISLLRLLHTTHSCLQKHHYTMKKKLWYREVILCSWLHVTDGWCVPGRKQEENNIPTLGARWSYKQWWIVCVGKFRESGWKKNSVEKTFKWNMTSYNYKSKNCDVITLTYIWEI